MKFIIFNLLYLACVASIAIAEKRSYECVSQGASSAITINFSVKDGDILDKVSGKVVFGVSDYKSDFKGTYNPVLDVFLAYVQTSATAKKKAVTGRLEDETFYLSIKAKKGKSVDFSCPEKKKKSDLLTGDWAVNATSFYSIHLNEGFDGAITGSGLGSFADYTIRGTRTNDGEVNLEINSPDGQDNSSYTMQLCTSGSTMNGKSNSTISPETVMCRKNRAINQECQPDTSCTN
jgi:hypothetical protein